MWLYGVTIVVSAFLLFLVQPIIAKQILPWFGGTSAVWTTCMLFFQSALLLGYLYVDWCVRKLSPAALRRLHMALLTLSLLLLPILPGDAWKPQASSLPTAYILLLLLVCVGLPYTLLATTSPLLQTWYTRTHKGALPYRLFALSNIGSLLALLSYPFLLEPLLTTHTLGIIWSVVYGVFVLLCLLTAYLSAKQTKNPKTSPKTRQPENLPTSQLANQPTRQPIDDIPDEMSDDNTMNPDQVEPPPSKDAPPTRREKLLWLVYAALPSAMLLAVTSHLTHEVAAMPFLWILPLALYLLTFVLCFDADGWYKRGLFLTLLLPTLGWMTALVEKGAFAYSFRYSIIAFSLTFFVVCMFCHGEMVRRKPDPKYLTSFYLMLSLGGALGGVFVGLVAPTIFSDYFELPLLILCCAALAVYTLVRDPGSRFYDAWDSPVIIGILVGVVLLFAWNGVRIGMTWQGRLLSKRNFYGVVRVKENLPKDPKQHQRILYHGAIRHGDQWLHPSRRRKVVSFYCPDTGVGRAIRHKQQSKKQIKVGVLGLGAGTMAGFARPADTYRFYEINPAVVSIAETMFYFIPDARASGAKVETILGDARLSLERESKQSYDVLVVDCFSSDAIPAHLLTREAVALYFSQLRPDGLLALHVSNHFVSLEPIVERIAHALGKATLQVETPGDEGQKTCYSTTWLVLANQSKTFAANTFEGAGKPIKPKKGIKLWTDAYSSLFDAVGW